MIWSFSFSCYNSSMSGQEQKKWAIMLVGPIGAGKGTQAELLAEDFGLVHLETSKIIEEKFAKADPNDPDMKEEYEIFKSGKLNTPAKVRQWVIDGIRDIADQGKGIVFSSSPRTIFEVEGELPVLEEQYGSKNVFAVEIDVSEEVSIKRNSNRRICKANRHPIPNFPQFKDLKTCPRDGSELITRVLDKPDIIKVRYATYLKETFPIIGYLKDHGHTVLQVNGDQSIEAVHEDVVRKLHGLHASMHTDILSNQAFAAVFARFEASRDFHDSQR